jgi:hypothetical protein
VELRSGSPTRGAKFPIDGRVQALPLALVVGVGPPPTGRDLGDLVKPAFELGKVPAPRWYRRGGRRV